MCQQLPVSLQALNMGMGAGLHVLQLGRLSSLAKLRVFGQDFVRGRIGAGSVLPPHLTALVLLLTLAETVSLPATLVHLELVSHHGRWAFLPAPCVQSVLSRLEDLELNAHVITSVEEYEQQLVAAIAHSGTRLTRLAWHMDPQPPDNVLGAVVQLRQLRDLLLDRLRIPRDHDFIGLTALSALTSLVVCGCAGLRDKGAVALLCGLTGLQRLHFDKCHITDAVLPVVARLTRLVDLNLMCDGIVFEAADMRFLDGLTCLERLCLNQRPDIPPGALSRADFPRLKEFSWCYIDYDEWHHPAGNVADGGAAIP